MTRKSKKNRQQSFFVPEAPVFEAVSAKFRKAAEEKGITLEDLLRDLRRIRMGKDLR